MTKKIFFAAGLAYAMLGPMAPASAQMGNWGSWQIALVKSSVEIAYRTRHDEDIVQVQWRCRNSSNLNKGCSIGNGRSKEYRCFGRQGPIGESKALAEMEFIRPGNEYLFAPDDICRGLNAVDARPVYVDLHISDQ